MEGRKIIIGGENRAYKDNFSVHRMRAAQLQHQEGQERASGEARDEEVLQVLPQTHSSQRNKVKGGRADGRDKERREEAG